MEGGSCGIDAGIDADLFRSEELVEGITIATNAMS